MSRGIKPDQEEAWRRFDAAISSLWPIGSRRTLYRYTGANMLVDVFCGSCGYSHRPKYSRVVDQVERSGPLCLARNKQSATMRSKMPPGETGLNHLVTYYRAAAKKRNHQWDMDREFIRELVLGDCFWCGISSEKAGRKVYDANAWKSRQNIEHGAFGPCLGIDRVHNNGGYTADNVVASCRTCNWAKSNLSLVAWLAWLGRIGGDTFVSGIIRRLNAAGIGTDDGDKK